MISNGGGGLKHPDMKLALALGFATFTSLAVTLVWQRMRLHLCAGRLAEGEAPSADEASRFIAQKH